MEVQLKIVGIVQILLAIIHLFFPRKFDWKNELHKLSLLNQQMMQVHTFFIALTVFLMGILNLSSAELLINTELGKRICLGMGIFWLFFLVMARKTSRNRYSYPIYFHLDIFYVCEF